MKSTPLVPMLWVGDIEQTIAFYRDVLGFACTNQMKGWACLANHRVELMISLPNQHEPFDKPQFTGSFYFHPDDVDVLWGRLKETRFPSSIRERISVMECGSLPSAITADTSCRLAGPIE